MSSLTLPRFSAGKQPFTVLIEGNIGSGKTTFINRFHKYDDICVLSEPVSKWRNLRGVNLLEFMYKDPLRWAMPFQSYVTLTILQNHIMQTDKRVKLMERSLYSARKCFVENMYNTKVMEEGMYHILQEWYDFIDRTMELRVDLIVYLRTSPEVVFERMKKRARCEESCIPFKYLEQLHNLHENWLLHNRSANNTKVLVLDANLDLEEIGPEYERSENTIFGATLQQQQPQAVIVSPSKLTQYSS